MNSSFGHFSGKRIRRAMSAFLGFVGIASLMAGVVIYDFIRVNLLIGEVRVEFNKTHAISLATEDFFRQVRAIDSYLLYRDNRYLEEFADNAAHSEQEIERLNQLVTPERKALVTQLLGSQLAYTNFINENVIPLAQKGDFAGAIIAARQGGGDSLFDHMVNVAQEVQTLRQTDALSSLTKMDRQLRSALWSGFTMGVFLVLFTLAAAIMVKRAENRYRTLFQCSRDAIMTFNPSTFRLSSCNQAAVDLFGSTGEVYCINLSLWDMSPERQPDGRLSAEKAREMIKAAIDKGSHLFEWTYRQLNGREFPATVLLTRMEILGKAVMQATVRDITEYKDAEKHIRYLNQIYAALAQTNRVIAFGEDETTLFQEVCRIAVQLGGMTTAWIGISDESSGLIKPVARFGSNTEYLDNIIIATSAHVPEGRGPAGTAFRDNKPVIIEDYRRDERTIPWHDLAVRYDWKANAAFPVRRGDKPYGVFSVHYTDRDFFDREMLDLLNEMASDLSHALDRFDLETARRRAVEALVESESFNTRLVQSTHEGVLVWNNEEHVTFCNRRAAEIFGYDPADIYGRCVDELVLADDLDRYRYLIGDGRQGKGGQFELRARHKEGVETSLLVSATPLFNPAGEYNGGFSMFTDITERKAAERRIQQLAHFDALTGLPNRSLLAERAKQEIKAVQDTGEPLAVIFLDLDHFKNINDTLGHRIGDELLIKMAKRIQWFLREEDTLSRLGGDEFMLLLPRTDAAGAAFIAESLLHNISQSCQIDEYELATNASIGIAISPMDGHDLDNLYRCADIAMYEAKQAGRNTFRFFTPEMRQHYGRRLQLVSALRQALDHGELMLYYQPQVSLHDGKIVGVEALLRWQHPKLGMVSPAEFIPLAEESGLILPIGEWVLKTAIRQIKRWIEDGLPPMTMAVNLSAIQWRQQNLPQLVAEILHSARLPAEYLELELTESVAMKDPEIAASMMHALHERGIRMVIDDFGTGYSSLAYLRRFQSYKLKIDQSFVRDIASDPEAEIIVDAVISLARSLRLRTLAEGVENEQQLRFLHEKGCEEVQGYYFSRPLPPDALVEWMKSRKSQAWGSVGQLS